MHQGYPVAAQPPACVSAVPGQEGLCWVSVGVQPGSCNGEEGGCGLQVCGGQGGGVAGQWVADTETFLLVCLQHVGEAEALATHVARVGLLSRVRSPVPLHVGPAGEALATDLTDVWLLPCGWRGGRSVTASPSSPGTPSRPTRGQEDPEVN